MNAWNMTFTGLNFFVNRPKLWLIPLLTTLVIAAVFIFLFGYLSYVFWPAVDVAWPQYMLGMFKATAKSFFIILLLWIFLFPIALNFSFESLVRKTLTEVQAPISDQSIIKSTMQNLTLIFQNLGFRIFWPALTLVSLFVFPFASVFIAQLGIGHIAVLDSASMAYVIMGKSKREQNELFETHRGDYLTAGLLAGVVSLFVLPTVIFWIFLIPSIYIGCALFVAERDSVTSDKMDSP